MLRLLRNRKGYLMKVCSIVVLYEPDNKEIENILDYYDSVDKVYILDNSMKNREKIVNDILSENCEHIETRVKYIHFHKNIGLCKALNYGMRLAIEESFEWALIMDADSTFNTNVVSVYKEYIREHDCNDIGILSPVHLYDRKRERQFEGSRDVPWAMTSGCFYNINVFWKFNGFKEELFVDGLDLDYCYKITRNGYRVVELADARLNHFPGETRTLNFAGIEIKYGIASPWRYYMQSRAIVWLILEYHSIRELARYGMKWTKVIFLFENKKDYIKQLICGTKDGISLWKNIHV